MRFKEMFRKDILAWALYDFGNSSYSLFILSFIFPVYFKEVIARSQYGDFYWGLIGSISILIAGLVSPVLGAAADYDNKKKTKLIWCTLLSILATFLLYFSGSGTLIYASLIFMCSNLFYLLAYSFYDSFLARVSSKKNAGIVSGFGYGLGYLGGIIVLLLMKPLYSGGYTGEHDSIYRLIFPLTALFFLIFSLPSFIYLKDKKVKSKQKSIFDITKASFLKTAKAFKEFKKEKHLAWFLVAFYFMNDALTTIFAFVSLYGVQTLKLSINQIGIILLIVQVIGIPAAFFFGWLADKMGQRKVLLINLFGWVLITLLLGFGSSMTLAYIAAVLTGLFIGGSQSVARSWFSNIVPERKRFVLFGFNSFASKISAVIGPILFGAVSSFSGNQRLAMLSLVPFFIISFIIFYNIKKE
jgi:UMF1 family MFS transporter